MIGALLLASFLFILFYLGMVMVSAFYIWMLVHAAVHEKFVWMVVIVGLPVVGAVIYYFTEKRYEEHLLHPSQGVLPLEPKAH